MNESLNQQIGERLRQSRQDAGCSAEQTAKLLNVSPSNYRRIEKGIHILTPDKFVTLREAMNIDPLYLLTGEIRENNIPSVASSIDEEQIVLMRELFNYCRSLMETSQKEEDNHDKDTDIRYDPKEQRDGSDQI